MHEGRQPDRDDHGRLADDRRRDRRGPTPEAIDRALTEVANHDVPGTADVGALKVLQEVHSTHWSVNDRTLQDFSINGGDPQHGALRSDDHVGRYKLTLPLREIADSAVPHAECPNCHAESAVYEYSAYHHIAGSEHIYCRRCEDELYREEWG